MIAFVFPGQGSQHVGMGRDYVRHEPDVFEELFMVAQEALGFDIKQYCLYGPMETLTSTEIAQPAILTISVGIHRLLVQKNITPDYVAGHSVGQFSALVAAGSLSFEDALQIVHQRGKSMQSVTRKGTMLAVVSSQVERMQKVLVTAADHSVEVAAHNSPQQIVFSGEIEKIKAFQIALDSEMGIRTRLLQVSQAFHSSLMEEMESEFMNFVQQFPIADPTIPVVLNCSATSTLQREDILEDIRLQCTYPVLWRQTMEFLHDAGVYSLIEVGPNRTLTGFMRAFGYDHIRTYTTDRAVRLKKNMRAFQEIIKK